MVLSISKSKKMKQLNLILLIILSTSLVMTSEVKAQQPYIGEIRIFAGNFAPAGWALCAGQLLAISENDALFSLLGTTYGGDGQSTFGIPDLRGRLVIHAGQGPGLSNYIQGEMGGQESKTLTNNNIPSHTHSASVALGVSNQVGNTSNPTNAILANTGAFDKEYTDGAASGALKTQNVTMGESNGGNQAIDIRQPFNTVNYIISLYGVFPSPN